MFRGGCLAEVEALLHVRGDHILYVGDHIYGDVLRAKKESSWRTLMIIQEMTDELDAMERYAPEIDRLHRLEGAPLRAARRAARSPGLAQDARAQARAERPRRAASASSSRPPSCACAARSIACACSSRRSTTEYTTLEQRLESAYHPFWGSPFKAESELSSFGEQVERYACLYTDRVTNLLRYSPSHYFRGPRHRMAHE